MSGIFKDFNKIIPEVRIAKLGELEIDVSKLPSRTAIEMAIYKDTYMTMSQEEQVRRLMEIVAKVCSKQHPEITVDWLLDNTHFEQLIEFNDFVLEPINGPGKKKLDQDQ